MKSDDILGKLEDIRLRNLQLSRTILSKKTHWTDDELNGMILRISEDLTTISFTLKRLINRFD